jgi:hypothetical protein
MILKRYMRTTVCVLDPAGLEESQKYGLRKKYKFISVREEMLIPYVEEFMADHPCGFQRNRKTTDQIFCIRQILEKKWEHNEAMHQLFIDFKKAYDPVRWEGL